jgi:hypothetical protein
MKMERVVTMDESKASAPDKDQPHTFQPAPDSPLQQGIPAEGTGQAPAGEPNCALCGAPRGDRKHLEGKAEADTESPNWGL